jgi:hypothetical protein
LPAPACGQVCDRSPRTRPVTASRREPELCRRVGREQLRRRPVRPVT